MNQITDLIKQGIGQPKSVTLNLAVTFTDREFNIAGSSFGVWSAPNDTDQILVRFNDPSSDQIPFERGKALDVLFNRVFITVPAGIAGNMVIVYGTGTSQYLQTGFFKLYPQINEPSASLTVLQDIRAELQGDIADEGYGQTGVGVAAVNVIAANVDRKGFSVEADINNTQPIYVGFDNTVAANKNIRRLVAGGFLSGDDYRGDIYCIAGGAGQNVNWGEW